MKRFTQKDSTYYEKAIERLQELEDKIENGTLAERDSGEWIKFLFPNGKGTLTGDEFVYCCSVCTAKVGIRQTRFCPYCGAKMYK